MSPLISSELFDLCVMGLVLGSLLSLLGYLAWEWIKERRK